MSLPHNDHELGKPLRNKKKRGAVFIVIFISIAVHVLGGLGLAVIKIVEAVTEEPEFEAPPIVEAEAPPPPPPPPPTPKRTQRSMPRPQPLAAQNPQSMDVPAIAIDHSALNLATGRGLGGGTGALGGGILDRMNKISFFGIESGGGNVAILFDRSFSSIAIFPRTRTELTKTIEQMKGSTDARLLVVYFGGNEAGQLGLKKEDPTKYDFWFPKNVPGNRWLRPEGRDVENILKELNSVEKPGAPETKVRRAKDLKGDAFFVLGTQYWGALNAAFRMQPAPDTVYFMVEPRVAFPEMQKVEEAYEKYAKFGATKPPETEVYFIVGKPKKSVKNIAPMRKMVDLINGGGLTPQQIDKYIIYD